MDVKEREALIPGVKPLWKIKDLQAYLGCSRTQVWHYIRRMELPCFKIGDATSALYFHPEEVQEWERVHEIDATRKVVSQSA